jgi:hypothetical protein
MKNCYTLLIVLISSLSFGQNWKLIDEKKTYFYKHSDSLLITNAIKTKTVTETAADTSYSIQTRLTICDTCTVIPAEAIGGILYNAFSPEFFGFNTIYTVATNDYLFADGIIKHHAQLSDSWLFDSGSGITATLASAEDSTIFGVLDSIKIIQLSTLDTIIISKNNGIIRYPDFENAGKYFLITGYTKGQNSAGDFVPNMWQVYDFNAGDEFCYEGIRIDMSVPELISSTVNVKIIEDLSVTDTLIYKVKYYGVSVHEYYGPDPEDAWPDFTVAGSYFKTLKLYDTSSVRENNYGFYEISPFVTDAPEFYQQAPGYLLDIDNISYQCEENPSIEFGYIDYQFSSTYGYMKRYRQFNFYGDSLCYRSSGATEDNKTLYAAGIGLIDNFYFCFETGDSDMLNGFVKDGDTTGTICGFPEDLGFKIAEQNNLRLYPNPATNQIQLDANYQEVQFHSLTGKLILLIQNPGQTIAVGDLAKGIYLVKAVDMDGNLLTTKLIIE